MNMEMKKLPNMKVTVILIVVRALGKLAKLEIRP